MNANQIYKLNDKPPLHTSVFIAFQHLLAVFGGIVTAPLIIALGMGLSVEDTSYLVSSSLVISGVATLIQINRIGPIGSGLLSIQGTSFTFIGPIISAYFMLVENYSASESLGMILGSSAVCALIVGLLGQYIEKLQAIITSNVTGTTVILIGMSLVLVTFKNIHREFEGLQQAGGSAWLIVLLAVIVFATTLLLSRSSRPFLRIFSVTAGLLLGTLLSFTFGLLDLSKLDGLAPFFIPKLNQFPLQVNIGLVLVLLPIFIISSIETIGDLTATSALSRIEIGSKDYWRRIRGGISGDAFNSMLASIFCTFPNTSFSQNNGVIRLTGVSSRHVGRFTAMLLGVLGLFPLLGAVFIIIPSAVLYGATLLMFIMVFLSGVAIVQSAREDLQRWWVVGISVLSGWVLSFLVPTLEFLPESVVGVLSFPISTGAIVAMILETSRKAFASYQLESQG